MIVSKDVRVYGRWNWVRFVSRYRFFNIIIIILFLTVSAVNLEIKRSERIRNWGSEGGKD
jgi:hypothetical protein